MTSKPTSRGRPSVPAHRQQTHRVDVPLDDNAHALGRASVEKGVPKARLLRAQLLEKLHQRQSMPMVSEEAALQSVRMSSELNRGVRGLHRDALQNGHDGVSSFSEAFLAHALQGLIDAGQQVLADLRPPTTAGGDEGGRWSP